MAVLLLGRALLIGYLLYFPANIEQKKYFDIIHLDPLMQDCSISNSDVLEIRQSYAKLWGVKRTFIPFLPISETIYRYRKMNYRYR